MSCLTEDREALLSGLRARFLPENQSLPLPKHLFEALLDAHWLDDECNESLAAVSCGRIEALNLNGSFLSKNASSSSLARWRCTELSLTSVKLNHERLFEHLNPERVSIEGSYLQVADISVLAAPLRSCSGLKISAPIEDELFVQLGKQILCRNVHLRALDLTGSGVDLMAPRTRRNSPFNLAAEMRRWSRPLKELSFVTEHPLCRVIRVLGRQCTVLRSLTVSSVSVTEESFKLFPAAAVAAGVEPHLRLKHLCLRHNHTVSDQQLISCLKSLPNLEVLDVIDCPVNFHVFKEHLPVSLRLLRTDEGIEDGALPFEVEVSPSENPNISVMRLMHGAQSLMSN